MARPKANTKQAPAAAAPAAVDAGQPVSETTLPATGTAAAAPDAAGVAAPAAEVQPAEPAPAPELTKAEPVAKPKALMLVPTLVIVGPAKGRWRIGKKFGPEPVSLALGDLTEDEMHALDADPELHVTVVDAPH